MTEARRTGGQCTFSLRETREHLAGLGRFATWTFDSGGPGGEASYPHGDLVGSTVLKVDAAGLPATTVAYTAFGEPISAGISGVPSVQGDADWAAVDSIYRYCGTWNYQTGSLPASVPAFDSYEYPVADDLVGLRATNPTLPPIVLTHVGFRWYDASIGRFLQRDPIGLGGGVNVYVYVTSSPITLIDPLGLHRGGLDPRGLPTNEKGWVNDPYKDGGRPRFRPQPPPGHWEVEPKPQPQPARIPAAPGPGVSPTAVTPAAGTAVGVGAGLWVAFGLTCLAAVVYHGSNMLTDDWEGYWIVSDWIYGLCPSCWQMGLRD